MQTEVRAMPRTGREPIWHYQAYRGDQLAPIDQGTLHEFEKVKQKIRAHIGGEHKTFVRIIGPREATSKQIDELRQMGAYPTFP